MNINHKRSIFINFPKIILSIVLGIIVLSLVNFGNKNINKHARNESQITESPIITQDEEDIETGAINFTNISRLYQCSSFASDMPDNNSCWSVIYNKEGSVSGTTSVPITLGFNSGSYCDLGDGLELCQFSKIESFYKANFGQNVKVQVEGNYDPTINPIFTVVKLTVVP